MERRFRLIIISGPSTVGKNPLISCVCEAYKNMEFLVPITTRKKRTDESEGIDYHFLSVDAFQYGIINGFIPEWDYCLGNYYGYSYTFDGTLHGITHGLSRMALRIKKKHESEIVTIFLKPKNIDAIYSALNVIYSGNMLELRKALVKEEMMHSKMFDYVFEVDGNIKELLLNEKFRNIIECELP